jgi:hypothetical protein
MTRSPRTAPPSLERCGVATAGASLAVYASSYRHPGRIDPATISHPVQSWKRWVARRGLSPGPHGDRLPRVPLEGHWERQQTLLRRLGRRGARLAMVLAAAVAIAIVGVVVVALVQSPARSAPGCVDVLAASSTGGATLHTCGAEAAQWCRSAESHVDEIAREARARCRAAGYE